ncbi:hypothetical protein ABID23_001436 [Bartonella silvatica]|uniref:Phage protein n=1 Tax=Bartonella silvatica TaxID=357760 RepID=A0ABV2HIH4_9HYPH
MKTVSRIEIVPVKAEGSVVEASVNVKDKAVEISAEDAVAETAEKVDAVCRVKKS